MWFLFLAVASFLAFPSIMLLLWLADTLEARDSRSRQKLSLESGFDVLSIEQAFEPIFGPLWEAPIHALQLIEAGGKHGIPVSRLRPVFDQAASRFPEIYDGHGFEPWVQFLEDCGLVAWSGQSIRLTRDGREFLEYRFTTEALAQA
jgi:hypothetical protein